MGYWKKMQEAKKDWIKGRGDLSKYGIGFWIGAGVYSVVNMFMNYNHVVQDKILFYNYLITVVAIIGLILNIILLKRKKA